MVTCSLQEQLHTNWWVTGTVQSCSANIVVTDRMYLHVQRRGEHHKERQGPAMTLHLAQHRTPSNDNTTTSYELVRVAKSAASCGASEPRRQLAHMSDPPLYPSIFPQALPRKSVKLLSLYINLNNINRLIGRLIH